MHSIKVQRNMTDQTQNTQLLTVFSSGRRSGWWSLSGLVDRTDPELVRSAVFDVAQRERSLLRLVALHYPFSHALSHLPVTKLALLLRCVIYRRWRFA